jgi:hypothetical protein
MLHLVGYTRILEYTYDARTINVKSPNNTSKWQMGFNSAFKGLIWTTENKPQEWNMEIIRPIYKQGDKLECNNYRDITLLNKTYKTFSIILNERLKTATEKIIGECQCGFRRNKSTIDQMFVLRQMTEREREA